MDIPLIVFITSTCVWIFPPFKQYKSDFFYFFLILALADPIKLIAYYLFHTYPQIFSLAFAFLLIASLLSNNKQKYFFVILSILTAVILLSFSLKRNIIILTLLGTHLVIVSQLILYFMKYIQRTKAINLFLILLVTYEFITVIKLIAGILSYEQGAVSYYLGGTTQIFLGISFIFINIKTKEFLIVIKK